jgi:hypothetical protein
MELISWTDPQQKKVFSYLKEQVISQRKTRSVRLRLLSFKLCRRRSREVSTSSEWTHIYGLFQTAVWAETSRSLSQTGDVGRTQREWYKYVDEVARTETESGLEIVDERVQRQVVVRVAYFSQTHNNVSRPTRLVRQIPHMLLWMEPRSQHLRCHKDTTYHRTADTANTSWDLAPLPEIQTFTSPSCTSHLTATTAFLVLDNQALKEGGRHPGLW